MKNFITILTSIIILTFILFDNLQQTKQSYTSLDNRVSNPTQGFKGALEYLHRLKANQNGEIPIEAVVNARKEVESRRASKSS